MANNSAINNIYNYYLTTYAPKSTTKYDAHKKSELRGVYNSIVKLNKEDSLYIVDKSPSTREFAIGLKEGAREFRNTIASLGGLKEDELLNKKAAFSTNESLASATYIGETNPETEVPSFELEVIKKATPQVNTGKMLPPGNISLPEGLYSFDIGINGFNYEFQYNIKEGDTNKSVQEKLSRLINNTGIGLTSEVLTDEEGNSALVITSEKTGAGVSGNKVFNISDNQTSKKAGSVEYFGLDNVSTLNSDSEFKINGEDRHASGNTFTVEKMYEINLNRVSDDSNDTATISIQTDIESMAANIRHFIEGYNSFVDNANKYTEEHPRANRLVNELTTIAKLRSDDLSQIGLNAGDDGRFTLDEAKLKESVASSTVEESFKSLQTFTGSMLKKANDVSLNPMNYADKTVVAYKNPGHNFAAPYVASPYTGMIFSSYC